MTPAASTRAHGRSERGSRARSLMLTDGNAKEVAARLVMLAASDAVVIDGTRHTWMPRGTSAAQEAKVGRTVAFLNEEQRVTLSRWWLAARAGTANLPNWDVVSQATIGGREGLLLVEAKAHAGELNGERGGKRPPVPPKGRSIPSPESVANHARIGSCVAEPSRELCTTTGAAWSLSRDTRYQMSNRFAWAWKLASMGVPVALVYLGFLNAAEMTGRRLLRTPGEWEQLVRAHGEPILPVDVWDHAWDVGGVPLIPLIRSMEVPLTADVPEAALA